MTVRKEKRGGKLRWVIEIPYRDRRSSKRARYRRDAQVQTSEAAHVEERRLIAQLEELGSIPTGPVQQEEVVRPEASPCSSPSICTFQDPVDTFRTTKAITKLKRTTRRSYDVSIDTELLLRFGKLSSWRSTSSR